MSLWAKEITKKIFNRTFLIFFSVIFLYSLIDFSINSVRFSNAQALTLSKYYLVQMSNYLDIFLPIAFLIAMVRTLSEMNINKELLALFSAGLSKRKFIVPLLLTATLFSSICLYNIEIALPKTSAFMHDFQSKFFATKNKNAKKNVSSLLLSDQSYLVFSKYDSNTKTLKDAFWIKDFNDIWHIERIDLTTPPIGYFLDHLTREQNNRLVKTASYKTLTLSNLPITENTLKEMLIPLEQKSLSKLLSNNKNASTEQTAEKNTLASIKIILSLSFFWIVICLAPYCIYFSRSFSPIFILGISIFSFICFYAVINALSILCINQVLSCSIALWFPSILLLLLGIYNFFKESS